MFWKRGIAENAALWARLCMEEAGSFTLNSLAVALPEDIPSTPDIVAPQFDIGYRQVLAIRDEDVSEAESPELFVGSLQRKLEQFGETWFGESSSLSREEYIPWLMRMFSVTGNYSRSHLYTQYMRVLSPVCYLYSNFVKYDLIGNQETETLRNSQCFGRLFETIADAYDILYNVAKIWDCNIHHGVNNRFVEEAPSALVRHAYIRETSLNAYQATLTRMLIIAKKRGFRRYQDCCYEEIITEEGFHTHAWRMVCDIKQFVYESCGRKQVDWGTWKAATEKPGLIRSVIDYLQNCVELEFPVLTPSRYLFAFKNGIYDVEHDSVYWYDSPRPIPVNFVCCKYHNCSINKTWVKADGSIRDDVEIETPNFDRIFKSQLAPEDLKSGVLQWMYVFFGRLLYPVNKLDHWEVIPFIKGLAGTGKSTLGNVAAEFYNAEDVSALSSSQEEKFGLSAIYDKWLYVCYEVTRRFRLSQADLQSMISGERVTIPIKFKTARTTDVWQVPGILCGNELPNYVDKKGSLQRRFIIIEFWKHLALEDWDTSLMAKLREEMAHIILKCNHAYIDKVDELDNGPIWEALPAYFHGTSERAAESLNPLLGFLREEGRFEKSLERYVSYELFKERYMEFLHAQRYKIGPLSKEDLESVLKAESLKLENEKRYWRREYVTQAYIVGIGFRKDCDAGDIAPSASTFGNAQSTE